MGEPAPDIALARELLERWNDRWWGELADGMLQPTPRIVDLRSEGLDEFQAWAEAHINPNASYVEAAVANLARVAGDTRLVFDYDADPRDGYAIARPWYKDPPRRPTAVEDWEVHLRLLQNLAIELIRAVNLLTERVQAAGPASARRRPRAVVSTASSSPPMWAPAYADAERAVPQPYPGLRGFPAAIPGRSPDGFGQRPDGTPRTRAEFEHWVEVLEERKGKGSEPPPRGNPPFALPSPASVSADPEGRPVPRSLWAAGGVVGLFSLIIGLLDPPWVAGVAAGLFVATLFLHERIWKWRPEVVWVLVVLGIGGACGLAVQVAADAIDGGSEPVTEGVDSPQGGSAATPAVLDLSGEIEAFNETYGREWGSSIDFDAQDSLRFRFHIENEGSETTPPLVVQARWQPPIEGQPWLVQIFAGPRFRMKAVPGAAVVLRPQSRGVDHLVLEEFLAPERPEGRQALPVEFQAIEPALDRTSAGSEAYRLGRLGAGESEQVTFRGSGWLPQDASQVSVGVDFANEGEEHFQTTGSARPGERLRFHLLLHNSGWKGTQTNVRVSDLPRPGRGFTIVKAFAKFSGGEVSTGEAVISSEDGQALSFSVVPGTTRLWGYKGGDCSDPLAVLHHLPDGISAGGVAAGSVGGFRPRDRSACSLFVRGVDFEALASAGS